MCYRSLWITAAAKWLAVKPVQSDEWCIWRSSHKSSQVSIVQGSDRRVNEREGVIEGQQWQDGRIRCVWREGRAGGFTCSTRSRATWQRWNYHNSHDQPAARRAAHSTQREERSWICGFSTQWTAASSPKDREHVHTAQNKAKTEENQPTNTQLGTWQENSRRKSSTSSQNQTEMWTLTHKKCVLVKEPSSVQR